MNKLIKIFVVVQKNLDRYEPDYVYPYFYYTETDAINNAKARAVLVDEPDWEERFGIATYSLGDDATTRTTADEWNNRNRIS